MFEPDRRVALERVIDRHLAHRNPADIQCRSQLLVSLTALIDEAYADGFSSALSIQ